MKALTAFLLILACALGARADALYWCVNQQQTPTYVFAYASLLDEDGETVFVGYEHGEPFVAAKDATSTAPVSMVIGDAADYSSRSFYVELYNEEFDVVGKSGMISFADLHVMASIWDPSEPEARPPADAFAVTQFVIPEPTGAGLLLIGLAMLALRRKHRE